MVWKYATKQLWYQLFTLLMSSIYIFRTQDIDSIIINAYIDVYFVFFEVYHIYVVICLFLPFRSEWIIRRYRQIEKKVLYFCFATQQIADHRIHSTKAVILTTTAEVRRGGPETRVLTVPLGVTLSDCTTVTRYWHLRPECSAGRCVDVEDTDSDDWLIQNVDRMTVDNWTNHTHINTPVYTRSGRQLKGRKSGT